MVVTHGSEAEGACCIVWPHTGHGEAPGSARRRGGRGRTWAGAFTAVSRGGNGRAGSAGYGLASLSSDEGSGAEGCPGGLAPGAGVFRLAGLWPASASPVRNPQGRWWAPAWFMWIWKAHSGIFFRSWPCLGGAVPPETAPVHKSKHQKTEGNRCGNYLGLVWLLFFKKVFKIKI